MSRKNEGSSRSRWGLVLGLPGLLLTVALFYGAVGRPMGSYTWLLVDWCILQTAAGLAAVPMALFRRRRSEILWALYFLFSALLPLIIVELGHARMRNRPERVAARSRPESLGEIDCHRP